MSKGFSYSSYIRAKNQMIRAQNERIKEENQMTVDGWNKEIQSDLGRIENILSTIKLEKFDYEKYYQDMMVPLDIKKYNPLPRPNEKEIRRRVGCIKENKILEHFIKDRAEKRIKKGKEFEKVWKQENDKYVKDEQKHFDEYAKYKNEQVKINNNVNKEFLIKKEKYLNNDDEEVVEVIGTIIKSFEKLGYGKFINIIYEKCNATIEFEFINPESELSKIKCYRYLKTKNEVKEVYYTAREMESIFEKIVFNVMLFCAAKLQYFINDKINKLVLNGYVEKINSANGNKEKYYIFSCKLSRGDIPFDKLSLIDSKSFFDLHNAKYTLPLISVKKIKTISFDSNDLIDKINSDEINGFDFEKLSKSLLEKNGFENVDVTKASGDYGADVIAYKDGVKYAIQCKKYSGKVGVQAVQEVIASKSMYGCHVGVVLTNSYFTPNAIKLAETNGVLLWNKVKLDEMVKKSGLDNNTKNKITFVNINNDNHDKFYEEVLNKINKNNNSDDELEKEMNNLDLEEWQKELVRKGEYEPESFEEDDLEEDDYYYEDE